MEENLQKGLQLLQKEQGEMEQLLRQLVKIESPSTAKGGIAAFNCESGMMDGRIAVARKGIFNISYLIHGVAAHSGNAPEQSRHLCSFPGKKGSGYSNAKVAGDCGSNLCRWNSYGDDRNSSSSWTDGGYRAEQKIV